jgi:hemolysin activation/secretion protein
LCDPSGIDFLFLTLSGSIARCGLNHRLGLWQTSGLLRGKQLQRSLAHLAFSVVLCAGVAHAQDYDRIAPKAVLPVAPAQPLPKTPAPKADDDDTVLLKKLQGLVFVAKPAEVVKNGIHTEGVATTDVALPEGASTFTTMASGYIGKKMTHGDLNKLISDVILFFRHHDRPVVDVIVPEQDITTGTVQIIVLEGRLEKVTVSGNHWVPTATIDSGISVESGDEIRSSQLLDDLDWLNSNSFHTTNVIYHPGEGMGATNIELKTTDRFPLRPYVAYEDSGNASTGFDRYEAGFNWGDAFALGMNQQLNYQYTTSGDGQSLRAHAGSYVVPLPWKNTLTFFGSYTGTKGIVPPLIGITGRSYQISGRYVVPLPTVRTEFGLTYKESVGAGFDYKYNKNALEFGDLPAGGTLYDVDQFFLGYDGTETDKWGEFTIDDQCYLSPGNWGGNNNDAAFAMAHTGASSSYVYDTLNLARITRLPGDWTLTLRATVQFSNGNLAPSEQLGYGGYDTIRGYDEREVNSDEGYIFSTEIRTPPVSIGELCGHPEVHDQLQFVGFWDYGAAKNYDVLPGENSETPLSSVGGGVRYAINTYVSVRFDYGFQLLRTGLDNDHGSRSDLGVVISY